MFVTFADSGRNLMINHSARAALFEKIINATAAGPGLCSCQRSCHSSTAGLTTQFLPSTNAPVAALVANMRAWRVDFEIRRFRKSQNSTLSDDLGHALNLARFCVSQHAGDRTTCTALLHTPWHAKIYVRGASILLDQPHCQRGCLRRACSAAR